MRTPGRLTHVLADDRERNAGVIEALRANPTVTVRVARLTLGDYVVGDRLVVERKAWPDFACSVVDGRLFRQAQRLAASGRTALCILEGAGGSDVGVSREALQGALTTLMLIFGIPVLRAQDAAETARLIVYAADQLERFAAGRDGRPGWRPRTMSRRQRYILTGLPGIGSERADRLLTVFGSVERVMTATAAELRGVAGIGPKTATAIRAVLSATVAVPPDNGRPAPKEYCNRYYNIHGPKGDTTDGQTI
jgi:ERCC4-type nuclease